MELSLLRTELPLHLVHIRFDARSSEGSDVSRVHGKTLCLSLSLSLSLVCPANERTDARLKDCEKVSSVCERLDAPTKLARQHGLRQVSVARPASREAARASRERSQEHRQVQGDEQGEGGRPKMASRRGGGAARHGDHAWSKIPKISSELFSLTYGAMVVQVWASSAIRFLASLQSPFPPPRTRS